DAEAAAEEALVGRQREVSAGAVAATDHVAGRGRAGAAVPPLLAAVGIGGAHLQVGAADRRGARVGGRRLRADRAGSVTADVLVITGGVEALDPARGGVREDRVERVEEAAGAGGFAGTPADTDHVDVVGDHRV